MNKLKAVVFSAHRPLQLRACLESLFFYTDVQHGHAYVIYKDGPGYEKLRLQFPVVNWLKETSFDETFREFIKDQQNAQALLLLVDDIVFTRNVETKNHEWIGSSFGTLGIDLLMGINIDGYEHIQDVSLNKAKYVAWNWKNYSQATHWGYFFRVSATIYSAKTIKRVLSARPEKMTIPNMLEINGMKCQRDFAFSLPFLYMENNVSACVLQDINRVQNECPNIIRGNSEHTSENLLKAFEAGRRINWHRLAGIKEPDVFVGHKYFELI